MCVRTKTSYGCGHVYKDTEDCDIAPCSRFERYHFQNDWDCQSCKIAGPTVTRGREGEGRYGRAMRRSRERDISASPRYSPRPSLDIAAASPWAPPTNQEKPWDSPTRRKADDAWLDEHDDRMSDLSNLFERHSLCGRSSRTPSPHRQYERIVDIDERVHCDYEEGRLRSDKHGKKLQSQTRRFYDDEFSHSHSEQQHRRRRNRQRSHDSDGSMPSYSESPIMKHTPHKHISADRYYECGGYDRKHSRRHGAKTEPYSYGRSYAHETPVTGSLHGESHWDDQYEVIQPTDYEVIYSRGPRGR